MFPYFCRIISSSRVRSSNSIPSTFHKATVEMRPPMLQGHLKSATGFGHGRKCNWSEFAPKSTKGSIVKVSRAMSKIVKFISILSKTRKLVR